MSIPLYLYKVSVQRKDGSDSDLNGVGYALDLPVVGKKFMLHKDPIGDNSVNVQTTEVQSVNMKYSSNILMDFTTYEFSTKNNTYTLKILQIHNMEPVNA